MGDTSTTNNVDESKPVAEYKFPGPKDEDFDEDITKEEREYYKSKYNDLTRINKEKLHCTSCDKHLGSMPKHDVRMQVHPMLRTLVCRACHKFYNSGEFEQGDDGSELYCRWCGQGGQVYCCASCPIVICAKCVKRNFGASKVEEIENSDDWNCFKCDPKDLWDLRALCWALLRYCDMKNKLARLTEDDKLKERYEEELDIDESQCCKRRSTINKKKKVEEIKKETKKEIAAPEKNKPTVGVGKSESSTPPLSQPRVIISPPININSVVPRHSIQVKKFAMEMGENKLTLHPSVTDDKTRKAVKRAASPTNSSLPMGPVKIYPNAVPVKKIKNAHLMAPPVKINKPSKAVKQYTPIAPRPYNGHQAGVRYPAQQTAYSVHQPNYSANVRFPRQIQQKNPHFTNQMSFANDNINLSLESLTQGLDMSSMATAAASLGTNASTTTNTNFGINYPASVSAEDELLCTPDFMEPICEVLEESVDDDVECITPDVRPAVPAAPGPPVSVSRMAAAVQNYSPDNIVQMTEQDVTVNKDTGGLKFKVDPQTLSSHKMYRLPDGRIFAINVNPNMPGGYSATIVALAPENLQNSMRSPTAPPNRVTFPAKITTVLSKEPPALTAIPRILNPMLSEFPTTSNTPRSIPKSKPILLKKPAASKPKETNSSKQKDMKTSVEWLRYNLVDAVDLMEYVLKRLKKIDTNAQISELRTKSVGEMTALHRQLDQLLKTSVTRFTEVRSNLDDGLKEWLQQKGADSVHDDEDDDDVEILSDDGRDEPIFIDENSNDSLSMEDQTPKIISTQSINSSDTPHNTISNSFDVDPLLNAATDSSKIDENLLKDDANTSPLEYQKNSNKLEKAVNITSKIYLEDENIAVNVSNSSETSVIETDVQKTDGKNNSQKSDEVTNLAEEKIIIPDKDAESVHKATISSTEEITLVDEHQKSDNNSEINQTLKPKEQTFKASEAVVETKSANEIKTLADKETKSSNEDMNLGDEEPESVDKDVTLYDGKLKLVDEKMTSVNGEPATVDEQMSSGNESMTLAYDEQDSIEKDVTLSASDAKTVDEEMTSADEESKADTDSVMSNNRNSVQENDVPSEVVENTKPSDEDKILLEDETDNVEDKITEAEEDDLLSSKNDLPDTNAEPQGIQKANGKKIKKTGDSSGKVVGDVPIIDELIDNLLGSNDNSNLRSELEKFAEGALDTVDFVQPDFV